MFGLQQICYGIIYGQGSWELSKKLQVSEEEAKEFKETFFATFPGIQEFIDSVQEKCKENGFIETIGGRIRLLPNINKNGEDKSRAKRQAVNSTIQGSAADLIKVAMVNLNRVILKKELDVRLVLEMHDELIFEVRNELIQEFSLLLSNTMRRVSSASVDHSIAGDEDTSRDEDECRLRTPFSVVLPVNLKTGSNWSDLTDFPQEN